ncbi:MAG: polyribonucleotide nucleotidyltransferase, partial [Chlamydiia bacterium]|nr:polyribonucleotide nucleotidyltransferase [Chlamydiia bacterium]
MQRETHTTSVTVGGKDIQLETGYLAQQANGSVLLRCGETVIFCSACGTKEADANIDFFPLRVDYQENFSSVGKTSSGYIKRQGRPTERETLMSRLIDRPLRPLFPDGYYNEVQVLCYVWSFDGVHMPDPLAICAASAALVISDIPLVKPIGAVRVGMIDGQFVINPSQEQMEQSKLDLLLAGTQDAVLMIEGYCDFLTEEQVLEAIETGHQEIQKICQTLANWQQQVGKEKRITLRTIPEELTQAVKEISETPLVEALKINDKLQREEALAAIKEEVFTKLLPEGEESPYAAVDVAGAFKKISAHHMRQMILKEKKRSDGRQTTDVRPIDIRQSLLPRAHGSSVFTRGETQTMAICTLGGESMAQRYENVLSEGAHRFYLQYFFPPFSVGEVGRMGSAGRREIGHGKLAERALAAIIPDKTKFPYTIRIESNITESNGSS